MFTPYWKLPPNEHVAALESLLADVQREIAEYSKDWFGVPLLPPKAMFDEAARLIAQIEKIRAENFHFFH